MFTGEICICVCGFVGKESTIHTSQSYYLRWLHIHTWQNHQLLVTATPHKIPRSGGVRDYLFKPSSMDTIHCFQFLVFKQSSSEHPFTNLSPESKLYVICIIFYFIHIHIYAYMKHVRVHIREKLIFSSENHSGEGCSSTSD